VLDEVIRWYGVTPAGNFEGSNILHRPERGAFARPASIEAARAALLSARESRVRPLIDDKVITEWNAMFVSTLVEASVALDRSDWLDAAVTAASYLQSSLRISEGRWLRTGGSTTLAFAGDYAWLVDMFTRLGEATGVASWRAAAVDAAQTMLEVFWDEVHGGLFTTGHDAERLVVRQKDVFDGAQPSANSQAALALIRLYALTDSRVFLERAVRIIENISAPIAAHPTAFPNFFVAIGLLTADRTETVIAGDNAELVRSAQHAYLPNNVLLWGERDDSPLWEGRNDGAYVCRNQTCEAPVHTPDDLLASLIHSPKSNGNA
jgi:uncharacterized protein YyaL (SSP411 family)